VTNLNPGFGLVEDRDHTGFTLTTGVQISCGTFAGSANICKALYEYGRQVVLDAQWDMSESQTARWEGCDPPAPGSTPNDQLCPVTMTRNRQITIDWQ